MKPLLVIEQDETLRGLGVLGRVLEARGLTYRRLRTWSEDLAGLAARDFAGIVALGGSQHAWEEDRHPFLHQERLLLAEAVEREVPVLGVCLGGQVLARALGAEVRPGPVSEIGWLGIRGTPEAAGDPVLGHLDGGAGVYEWHVDGFDLPDGAVRLATSDLYPNQAFRLGEAWGVQFHPEVDYALLDRWLAANPGACDHYGVDEATLRQAVRRGAGESRAFAEGLFSAFALRAAGGAGA